MLGVQSITSLKRGLHTTVTRQNTTENVTIILQAQDTTAFQPSVCSTRIHFLLVMNIERSGLSVRHRFQGQSCTREPTTVLGTGLLRKQSQSR